jgi:hypothetical protein
MDAGIVYQNDFGPVNECKLLYRSYLIMDFYFRQENIFVFYLD